MVSNLASFLELVEKIELQVAQLVARGHVQLVVGLGGQQGGTQLTEHHSAHKKKKLDSNPQKVVNLKLNII